MNATRGQSKLLKNQDGLTLIETLIALAIFSIGILGVAQLQLWNIKNNTTGNITTQATMLARAKLEELKNISDVMDLTGGEALGVQANGDPGGIFDLKWDPPTNPHGGSLSRQIKVTVSWNRIGQNRSIVLTTITKGNGT